MSKRKSSSQSLQVKIADMVFEEDSEYEESEDQHSIAGDSAKGSVSRVSGRAKKAKAIYDPSEYNGPVHKRKKEALEAEKLKSPAKPAVAKQVYPAPKAIVVVKNLTGVTLKSSPVAVTAVTPSDETTKAKTPTKKAISVISAGALHQKKPVEVVIKARKVPTPTTDAVKVPVAPAVPVVKEPSKRIQARKQVKKVVNNFEPSTSGNKKRRDTVSTTTALSTDEYDKASTIEYRSSDVPDVRKWSHQQVFEYFQRSLGFSRDDSLIFLEEEIDGEALMIMKRSDIVTTKFQKLKLGTALKMWSQILMFQTGSSDPTQAWK